MHKINGKKVDTTLLAEELAPLNAQVEKTQKILEGLENELQVVEAEIDKYSVSRERFNTLGEVCSALEKLEDLGAGELFWEGFQGKAEDHLSLARERITGFESEISNILKMQESLKARIDRQLDELDDLNELVRDAYERDERRKEEFVIEREATSLPFREMIMPWTKDAESEKRFRKAVLVALLVSFVFGSVFHIVKVPVLEHEMEVVEIPERLAKLVKKEPIKPVPPPKQLAQKTEESPDKPKDETKPVPKKQEMAKKSEDNEPKVRSDKTRAKEVAGGGGNGGVKAARRKAERVGVLAFKNSFSDLMEETPIAKIGTEARLRKDSPMVAGQAVAQRSIISIQAKNGSSGGISYASVSRNVGSGNGNGLGGSGIGRGGSTGNGSGFENVESSIADIEESSRPLSDGVAAGRTDEEIQIVFDRYKATLYRIYNRELRKDPTLRGKILLRISIDPDGSISMCKVESTDLESPELVAKIVGRIEKFNFGAKDGVPEITILYPIDFLPAG